MKVEESSKEATQLTRQLALQARRFACSQQVQCEPISAARKGKRSRSTDRQTDRPVSVLENINVELDTAIFLQLIASSARHASRQAKQSDAKCCSARTSIPSGGFANEENDWIGELIQRVIGTNKSLQMRKNPSRSRLLLAADLDLAQVVQRQQRLIHILLQIERSRNSVALIESSKQASQSKLTGYWLLRNGMRAGIAPAASSKSSVLGSIEMLRIDCRRSSNSNSNSNNDR